MRHRYLVLVCKSTRIKTLGIYISYLVGHESGEDCNLKNLLSAKWPAKPQQSAPAMPIHMHMFRSRDSKQDLITQEAT